MRVGDDGVEVVEEIVVNTVTTSIIEITEVQEDEYEVRFVIFFVGPYPCHYPLFNLPAGCCSACEGRESLQHFLYFFGNLLQSPE